MIINVTQENINQGRKSMCKQCPVALAFVDAGFDDVYVYSSIAYFNDKSSMHIISLGYKVKNFISNFDDDNVVQPFSFKLDENGHSVNL